jgi:hypothetical protein
MGAPWTTEETKRLVELRGRGLTFLAISRAMGMTRSMIAGKVRRLQEKDSFFNRHPNSVRPAFFPHRTCAEIFVEEKINAPVYRRHAVIRDGWRVRRRLDEHGKRILRNVRSD